MDFLLAWQTLVFATPLAAGVVLLVGLALGVVGDGGDGGDGHGSGHVAGDLHAHGGDGPLDLGRVPTVVLAVSFLVSFGAAGLTANAALRPLLPATYGLWSLGAAAAAALSSTWLVARVVGRLMPAKESYNVRKGDLEGRVGHATVEITPDDGFLQLTDHEGNLHQVRGRSGRGTLAKGAKVVVVEYRPDGDWYLVMPVDEAPGPDDGTN